MSPLISTVHLLVVQSSHGASNMFQALQDFLLNARNLDARSMDQTGGQTLDIGQLHHQDHGLHSSELVGTNHFRGQVGQSSLVEGPKKGTCYALC